MYQSDMIAVSRHVY